MNSDKPAIPLRVYWILGAGLLSFSFSPILVRFAGEAPGAAVAVWRTILAVAFLLPFRLHSRVSDWRILGGRERTMTIAAGFLLGLHFIVWIESIYHTSVASASVLFTMNPLFIAGFGFLVLKERLSRIMAISIVVSVIGASLISLGDATDRQFPNAMLGDTLALSSAVLFAAYLLIGRVARQTSTWLGYVFPLYLTSAVTALAYALIRGVPLFGYGLEILIACALMALGPQILGHGSLNYAVKYFPAALIGLVSLVEPVLATIWAFFLFDEIPSLITLLGVVVTISALSLVYLPRMKRARGNSA